jgi:putative phosphonate metabolism protein
VNGLYSADMADSPRYAIYYAPAPGSGLDRFGAALLGYDAFASDDFPFPEGVLQATPDWRELTSDPRKYGFHATLKAPMSLASGRTEAELVSACEAFAATPRAIPVIRPVVDSISGFIAVIPAAPSAELTRLAADCVTEFDSFRALLTEAGRARRNPSQLTPRQREHLDRWGYPYVMDDFRFHMTLTGRVGAERRATLVSMLRDRFHALDLSSLAIDRIALFRQDNTNSRFRVVQQWELAPA